MLSVQNSAPRIREDSGVLWLSLPDSSTSAADEPLLRGFEAREQPSQRQVGKLSAVKLNHPKHMAAPHARRNTRNTIMRQTPWSRIREQNSVYKGDCWQWEANGQRSKGDNCSFRHDVDKRAKMTQPNPSPNSFMQQNERNASRTRSPRGRSPRGRMSRWPCKDYLKGTCTTAFCEKWHPPECLFYKSKNGCRFVEKCSYAHRQVDEQPSKRCKKNGDKSAVAMLKITRQVRCVCRDLGPPEFSSVLSNVTIDRGNLIR